MKKILLAIFLIILIGLALFCASIAKMIHEPIEIDYTLMEINKGDTGRTIAKTLLDNEIISNDQLFYYLIRFKKLDRTLKAGHYLFTGDYNMLDVINKIVSGEILVQRVTIPEGISIYRTLRILAQNEIGDYEKLLEKAKDPEFSREITGLNIDTLEGFLYPDTYVFGFNMTEERILGAMVANFYDRMENSFINMTDHRQFYDDLILASIVEREALFNDEMPLIAGVFLNRLRINMRLQADPTAVYHLEPDFIHRYRVTYADIRTETPFNTYVINGLPPHPICSPSVAALFAVQNPEQTRYLFFFADGTGRHIFTRTYEEHSNRLREMRRARG
ncbi:MAG: endolytic transglycosylase MltG [Candidatus Cloacimonetes bacterium]|nr:endolytic transglycosylase MltG [Candidatus Cloacimonadota bacterium]